MPRVLAAIGDAKTLQLVIEAHGSAKATDTTTKPAIESILTKAEASVRVEGRHHGGVHEAVHPEGYAQVPSCIDGRGAAPEEDSGGPNGWAQQQGTSVTPAPFDLDRVNARLAPLRDAAGR